MLNIEPVLGRIYHPVLHRLRCKNERRLVKKAIDDKISNGNLVEESSGRKKRIYIDLSDVFFNDKGTGIQRVSKNISKNLLDLTTAYEVKNVYFKDTWYFSCDGGEEIDFCRGDIFFVLDQPLNEVCTNFNLFLHLMKNGVKVVSFFHDLIPLTHSNFCDQGYVKDSKRFLSKILFFSEIICNSKSTADELKAFLAENPKVKRNPNLKISYSLLGSDFSSLKKIESKSSANSFGFEKPKINFLMVSTVEPRKMYTQAVKAFDLLWEKGLPVNLWIVGRRGWRSEKTFKLIEENPHFSRNLIWYSNGISDDELSNLYEKCDVVLFASIAEGFGLAVAEGAYFKKPLILRDIPVFREIAGDNAFYFSGTEAEALSAKIEEWLELYKNNSHPKSDKIRLLTWKDCSQKVLEILEGGEK